MPEASLGTHFFNDLVEYDMLYCAVYPEREGHVLNAEFLASSENKLTALLPDAEALSSVIKVIDGGRDGSHICVSSDVLKQKLTCYLDRPSE
ncbi:MAG: hypothetical protein A4E29_00113 [Methanomassiliicoccales archaeon PtaB.Bin134]|nr:MAG: hypothetical protein A4E29_00113 [Methanomassiliicoccales archaeon PtaB.Bin134]